MARDLAGNGTLGSYDEEQLFSGEADIVTDSANVPAELNLAKYTVLMKEADGDIVAWDGVANNACGILAQPIDTTAATGTGVATEAPFFKGGVFNPLALVWPAAKDTLEERVAAFERTNVVIRRLL
jgi:hypothetical protein